MSSYILDGNSQYTAGQTKTVANITGNGRVVGCIALTTDNDYNGGRADEQNYAIYIDGVKVLDAPGTKKYLKYLGQAYTKYLYVDYEFNKSFKFDITATSNIPGATLIRISHKFIYTLE